MKQSKILIFIIITSLILSTGCTTTTTLKKIYRGRSKEIKEYCKAVHIDAGYYKNSKPSKSLIAKCISQTHDREIISQRLFSIGLGTAYSGLGALYIAGLLIFFSVNVKITKNKDF